MLLRHCEGFSRVVFYMRALGHKVTHEYLQFYDAEVDKVLAAILGDYEGCVRRHLACRTIGYSITSSNTSGFI